MSSSSAITCRVFPKPSTNTFKIEVGGDGAHGQTELTFDDLGKLGMTLADVVFASVLP
jgi:hypothetical protein